MQLIILGSGSCVPSLKRSAPANFLKIKDKNILVDCGSGTLTQLEKARLKYKNIDIVFVTHFHTDHISDLSSLIQALNWTPNFTRKKDLLLVGPVGFKKYCKNFIKTKTLPNTFKIKIKEIKKSLKFKNFGVECVKTIHCEESIAYKFKEQNKSLVISGDTGFNENLIKFSKKSDVLLIECSFSNRYKKKGHLTPKECGIIGKEANVNKLILTHIYPPISGAKRLKEVKRIFRDAILAKDLMRIKI